MAAPPTPTHDDSSDFTDRRRYPRFRPLARVELSGGGEVASLPIIDISEGGIRLEMGKDELERLDIDEPVKVFLTAEGAEGSAYVTMPATVLRIQRGERASIALEWAPAPDRAEAFARVLGILEASLTP